MPIELPITDTDRLDAVIAHNLTIQNCGNWVIVRSDNGIVGEDQTPRDALDNFIRERRRIESGVKPVGVPK